MNWRIVAAVAALSIVVGAGEVRAQEDAIASMMNEITALSAELEKVPAKLDANLTLKQANESQIKVLDATNERLLVAKQSLDAEEPRVFSVCNVTVPQDQYAAAVARCNAAKVPFETRMRSYNTDVDKLNSDVDRVNASETKRAGEARQLLERRAFIVKRITELRAAVQAAQKAAEMQACTARCAGASSNEAASYCMQSCYDGAPSDASLPGPAAGASHRRTPEEAIEEYRRSGSANPGPSLHTSPVPPPGQ
jgi:peptidoglycan hydrolase CwlO-like protein